MNLIEQILKIGVKAHNSREEIKKIRLLNVACLAWGSSNIILTITEFFSSPSPTLGIATYLGCVLGLCIVLTLQSRKHYYSARLLFLFLCLTSDLIVSILLLPGGLAEYYLLLVPILSLLLFDKQWINLTFLVIAYSCFLFSMTFFGHYSTIQFHIMTSVVVFFAIFVTYGYFKQLNIKNEKSLEEQRNELKKLNEFQSHFWINLSHEIRTPLTLIKGSASQLLKDDLNEVANRQHQRISQNAEKIQILLDDIMDLAKMKSNKLELHTKPVNIAEFCRQTLAIFEPLFSEKNITYSFHCETTTSNVTGNIDALFMERALGNILLNACKYTPEYGKVTLTLRDNERNLSISVKDTGCGIPTTDQPRIFDTFYRSENTANEAGGTGVGLSFTKEVLELHGGTISVVSHEGEGAEFTLVVPQANEPTTQHNKYTPLVNPHSIKDITVLLVEDNPDMRSYIKEVLAHFKVIEATNGQEALNTLIQVKPDIVVTDYMMPQMDGYEMVKIMRDKNIDIPVIVLTARVDQAGKLDFLRLGIDDYLTKPFSEEELIIRMEHSLRNNKERLEIHSTLEETEQTEPAELIKVKTIIEKNVNSISFGVIDLADELAVTERTLQRKVKSMCGLTTNNFIREVKLQRALTLCRERQVTSIKQLALEVGFVNTGHFTRLFTERFGTSPADLLKT